MTRAALYSLLLLVVLTSCLIEYCFCRVFARSGRSKRWWVVALTIALSAIAFAIFRDSIGPTNCFVLLVGFFAGSLLSRGTRSPGALVTMLIVAAIVDLISTQAGPTRFLVRQAQQAHGVPAIQFLAVCLRLKGRLVPVIGVGDLMFFTICVTAMRGFGWPESHVLVLPLVALLSALALGLAAGLTPGIPFLAAAIGVYAYATSALKRDRCHT